MFKKLSKTKQQPFNKTLYGFDIETYGRKNKFLCATIVDLKGGCWEFRNKQKLIDFFKKKKFWNSYIVATNLNFDFHGVFFKTKEEKSFRLCYRGSQLIIASSYIDTQKGFNDKGRKGVNKKISFIDTTNYAPYSVKVLGEIVNHPKLPQPKAFTRKPKNEEEWQEMLIYNRRDSEISLKFANFILSTFHELGASIKTTIASTAMSLFRNVYLKNEYWVSPRNILLEQFEAYAGGRVEAISRGSFKNYNYYDINSLYPYVMAKNLFPDPSSLRVTARDTLIYIRRFEGISKVDITTPKEMTYPFLHKKTKDKLLFPLGSWTGWYTHLELREALKLGYKINKVHKTQYFRKKCRPFKEYVNELYKLRMRFKEEKDPMELCVKLLLNSLYGKFAQRFLQRSNVIHKDQLTVDTANPEPIPNSDYYRMVEDTEPPVFSFPIWAAYITAYARIELYSYIKKYEPIYYDTDSIITKMTIPTSKELGGMKKEHTLKKLIVVRPKFYCFETSEGDFKTKIKGVPVRFKNLKAAIDFLDNPTHKRDKILKFKEALRRNLKPNEIVEYVKVVGLEDEKRIWRKKFNYRDSQVSSPIFL